MCEAHGVSELYHKGRVAMITADVPTNALPQPLVQAAKVSGCMTPASPGSSSSGDKLMFWASARVKQDKVYLASSLRLWHSPCQCTVSRCDLVSVVLVHVGAHN